MEQYLSISGTIIQMNWPNAGRDQLGCSVTLTIQSGEQGLVNVTVDSSTFVLNNRQLNTGETVTCFYSGSAPAPLIYPPIYRAVAVAYTPAGTYADLDTFNGTLTNSKDTLRLNPNGRTRITLPNGQFFRGYLSGKTLLVLYGATTKSIPAQTVPEQIVVFCQSNRLS